MFLNVSLSANNDDQEALEFERGGPLPWVSPILLVLLVCDLSRAINSIGVYRKRDDCR